MTIHHHSKRLAEAISCREKDKINQMVLRHIVNTMIVVSGLLGLGIAIATYKMGV